jgi:hypothetical protein
MLGFLPLVALLALLAAGVVAGRSGASQQGGRRPSQRIVVLVGLHVVAAVATPVAMVATSTDWIQLRWMAWVDPVLRPFGLGSWSDLSAAVPAWSRALGGGPSLELDLRGAILLAALAMLVAVAVFQASAASLESLAWPLLIAACSMLFVASSASPLGLVAAWLILDALLFRSGLISRRGLLASQLGLWILISALAALPIDHETLRAGDGAIWEIAWSQLRGYLVVAGAVRMGLYPFTWTVPRTPVEALWRGPLTRIAPLTAGLALLLRAATQLPTEQNLPHLGLIAFGLLVLLAAAVLAGTALDRGQVLDSICMITAAIAVLAVAVPGRVVPDLVLGLGLDLVLGRGLMFLAEANGSARLSRLWWLGAAGALGLPGTLGFGLRWWQLAGWFPELPALYGILLLLGLALPVAVLRPPVWTSPDRDRPGPIEAPARFVGLVLGILGILATLLLLGVPTTLALPVPSVNLRLALGLVLPLVLGLLLRSERIPTTRGGWGSSRLGHWLRTGAFFDAWRSALIQAGRALHRSINLMDSRRTMAWTVFAGLVIGLSILASDVGQAPAIGMGGGATLWLVTVAIAYLVLLADRPLTQLASLTAVFLLGSLALVTTMGQDDPAVLQIIALVKLLAGMVVVAILAIGSLESQRRADRAVSWRKAWWHRDRSMPAERRFLLLAAPVTFLLLSGIQSDLLARQLPVELLRPALTLICAGLLGTVFAEGTLRLACCAFVALVGFELIYSRLDPGLLVTGGLAAFQIMLALLVSAFFGIEFGESSPGEAESRP